MKEYKTKEAILNHAPKLTEADIQKLNEMYTPYIFYNDDHKQQVQHCTCSHCRKSFDIPLVNRTQTPESTAFLQAGHNMWAVCPECKVNATKKNKGKAKSCASISREYRRAVYVKTVNENTVYLLYVYSTKNYKKYNSSIPIVEYCDYETAPKLEINAWYYLTPNQQRCFIYNPWNGQIEEKTIREPFTKTWYYNTIAINKGYDLIGLNELKKTFMRYADIQLFEQIYEKLYYSSGCYWVIEVPMCKILSRFAKFPSMEWLAKQGYDDFVYSLIREGENGKTWFDWSAKSPYSFFKKLNKSEIKALKDKSLLTREAVPRYIKLRAVEPKLTPERFAALNEYITAYRFDEFLRVLKKHRMNLSKLITYFEKQKHKGRKENIGILWLDYIAAAEFCEYDLSVHNVVFPKRLKKAHDEAVNNKNRIIFEREAMSFEEKIKSDKAALKNKDNPYAKRCKKLQEMYEFDNGDYCIVIPTGMQEIILEGKALCHCVGGYASRHIDGKTTILFLRSSEDVKTPLATIEINDKTKTVHQAHGYENRCLNASEQAFLDKWLKNVKENSNKKIRKNKAKAA